MWLYYENNVQYIMDIVIMDIVIMDIVIYWI